ncbi:cytochrome c peroxidase [Gemmatimonas sp.]|jgi:cytochrome c peroxidase|uniref:cytochrome c peroxidase n=1 Tax=Gemmatimonas sp. TaxID=1962908 RepID=UPI0037C1A2F4
MKTFRISSRLLAGVLVAACVAPATDTPSTTSTGAAEPRAMQVVGIWRSGLDTLALRTAQLDSAAARLAEPDGVERARNAFVAARRAFKLVELGLEYYTPSTARNMNGPALPEVEETEGPEAVFPPTGFQVIEEILYGEDPVGDAERLTQETATLRQLVTRASTMMAAQQSTDDHVRDAAKLEVARIVTLGITGFDSPVAGHSLAEADAALEGLVRTLAPYRSEAGNWTRFDTLVSAARGVLMAGASRETFDHFAFIVDHANPLARALRDTRAALGIETPTERRAFRMEAATVFDSNAFDVMAFAPLDAPPMTEAQVTLGRQLFHDTRLSGDGRRACSSCHLPEKAFTDGLKVNAARGGAPLSRNTPTVINAGLQVGVFSDLRTTYLEDQVTDVVENVDEMHGSLDATAATLARDASLAAQFRAAFAEEPTRGDTLVTAARIRTALAAYQRSLSRLDSPVDRALRGEVGALSADERLGFNVFVGKGKCATCHFLPLTNGTVPPMYQKAEVEVLGVPSRAVTANATVDPDIGRQRLTRAEPHKHAFRTPSIRNVALTAPYMHNGVYRTLEEVVDFYDRGGGAGIGIALDNQTLPPDALKLTAREKRALVAFMRALTDATGTGRR